MIYRETVERLSLRQLRANFKPRDFARMDQFHVEAAGTAATIKIARVPAPTAHGGTRRWMVCPTCQRSTSVVGLVNSDTAEPRWACYRCTNWVSRRVPKAVRSNT